MGKAARNRRINHWVGGSKPLARRLRRMGWNGILPDNPTGKKCKTKRNQPLELMPRHMKLKVPASTDVPVHVVGEDGTILYPD